MSVLVLCSNPACGQLFDAPDEAVGTEMACPICGTMQLILNPLGSSKPGAKNNAHAPAPPLAVPSKKKAEPASELSLAPETPAEPQEDFAFDLAKDKDEPRRRPAAAPAAPEPEKPLPEIENPFAPEPGESDPTEEFDFAPVEEIAPALVAEEAETLLNYKSATAIIFGLGLLGMAAGLLIGVRFCEHVIWIYVCAGMGWVAGFVLAFLFVLSGEKTESKVRCPTCHNEYPSDVETCRWCGSPLSEPGLSLLAKSCLAAWPYPLQNIWSILWLVMQMVVVSFLACAIYYGLTLFKTDSDIGVWAAVALCALVSFLVFSYGLQLFLSVISHTRQGFKTPAGVTQFWSKYSFAVAFKGLSMIAMYVLPIFTIPLLPLGLLSLSSGRGFGFKSIPADVRNIWRQGRDFAILWLMLLLWSAGMILTLSLAKAVLHFTTAIPVPDDEISRAAMDTALTAIGVWLYGLIACGYGMILCRCIGLYAQGSRLAVTAAPAVANKE